MAKRLTLKRLNQQETPKQRERMELKRLDLKPLEKQRTPKQRERLKLERKTNVKRKS